MTATLTAIDQPIASSDKREASLRTDHRSSRRILALVAAALLAVGAFSVTTPEPAHAADWQGRWYGWDLQFNRRETNNLMFGSGVAAIVSSRIPGPAGWAATAVILTYTAYAGWVYNNGGCMKFRVTYLGGITPAHYFGGYCR